MPGLFGFLGIDFPKYTTLKSEFEKVWEQCSVISIPNGFMGGHAFSGFSAAYQTLEGLHVVVDGEDSIYRNAQLLASKGSPRLFNLTNGRLNLTVHCKGNIAVFVKSKKTLYLASEWSGSFPLYYSRVHGNLLFSSLLRPLAKVLQSREDPVGIVEFMRYGYTLAGRTVFEGIRRIMPGQVLVYNHNRDNLVISETSRAWTGRLEGDYESIAEQFWSTLIRATKRCIQDEEKHALMTSAGWDSRVLLASIREVHGSGLQGYSHGDISSRELKIASRILRDSEIITHLEALDESMYDLDSMNQAFLKVENIIFPHWNRAGLKLRKMGINSVSAGVLGEIVGGLYGRVFMMSDWEKIFFIASNLLRPHGNHKERNYKNFESVYDFLRLREFQKPWYIHDDYWEGIAGIKEEINTDVENSLKRIEDRGEINADQLIEAYVAESRGAQYIAAQLLTCRANLNISNIYADQELLTISAQIPLTWKIQRRFCQAVLRKYAPDLLKYPTAGILISTRTPIFFQEITRVVKKIFEEVSLKLGSYTKGQFKAKSLGWDNFEFLRTSDKLSTMLDNIEIEIVDKGAMREFLKKSKKLEIRVPMYHVSDQFMKIYSVDRMLS